MTTKKGERVTHSDVMAPGHGAAPRATQAQPVAEERMNIVIGGHEYAVSERIAVTYDSVKAAALFKRFLESGTWQTPTLFLERDRALHIPGNGLELESRYGLATKLRRPSHPFTPENSARSEAYFRRELQIVGAMYRAGVGILAGTDLPVGHAIPGYGLHEELSLMVESGLSPLAALQTATLNPAKFFGLTDSLGTVEQGKVADLVVLGADPLADIGNTNRIDAVIMGESGVQFGDACGPVRAGHPTILENSDQFPSGDRQSRGSPPVEQLMRAVSRASPADR